LYEAFPDARLLLLNGISHDNCRSAPEAQTAIKAFLEQ
jgi:hypothetical protein